MKRIYAIPGLGTTKELFRFLKIEGAEIIALNWPAIEKGETMESYALKFKAQIDTSAPFYLMGVSFGGMLSVELAKILRPEKTFLISSAKSGKEFPGPLRFFRKLPLHRFISEKRLRKINAHARHIIGFEKEYLPEFIAMMDTMQQNYFTYSINCIINWKRDEADPEILLIHGKADRLLPLTYVSADYTIDGGTHAMIIYKADEIARIIRGHLGSP